MTGEPHAQTPLFAQHEALGGKMVPFGGFALPVQYPTGIQVEHRAVREACGLFDVSHMGEFEVRGPDALDLVQKVTVNDASTMAVGQAQYSAMCREDGGVLDDLVLYRFADRYWMVVNAANRAKDLAWVRRHAERLEVEIEDRSDTVALLALQGPGARNVLDGLVAIDLDSIGYYRFTEGDVAGAPAVISQTGYTGEDGFELYLDSEDAESVWKALLEAGGSRGLIPCGLGARDSLRLEVGYALYGNDLDEDHTPLESGLGWITKLDKGHFVGRDALLAQKERGVERRLVGLRCLERAFPRPGYDVTMGEDVIGVVTSGTSSPTLGYGVALAYVPLGLSGVGSEMFIDVRGRPVPVVVERPPFYRGGSIRR